MFTTLHIPKPESAYRSLFTLFNESHWCVYLYLRPSLSLSLSHSLSLSLFLVLNLLQVVGGLVMLVGGRGVGSDMPSSMKTRVLDV